MYIKVFISSLMLMLLGNANAIVRALPLKYMEQSKMTANVEKLEALEKSSHEGAKKIPAVCAVIIDDPSDDRLDLFTGTYFAKIDKSGFVLTSAYIADKAKDKLQFLYLSFDSGYRNVNNRIAVKNVYIHPRYHRGSSKDLEGDETENDIAIIEFDASKLSSQIIPLPLDDTEDYNSPEYFEGIILGYGPYCTNISTLFDTDTIHFAKTYVYLRESNKQQPIFRINLPHISNFYPGLRDLYRFATTYPSDISSTLENDYPSASSFHLILKTDKIHPQQGFLTPGDNGGPLLFRDKNDSSKFRLAGIAQSSGIAIDRKIYVENKEAGNPPLKTAYIIWEPIFVHKNWIEQTTFNPSVNGQVNAFKKAADIISVYQSHPSPL